MLRHNCLGHSQVFFNLCCNLLCSCCDKIYHSFAFIVATENFFVATQVLPATLDYVATRSFFVSILLVLLFSILSRQGIHLLYVLFVATEIIFVATDIVLPLVVNFDCSVVT